MLLIVQKIITLSLSTVKLYTCQWPGVILQQFSSIGVLTVATGRFRLALVSRPLSREHACSKQFMWLAV